MIDYVLPSKYATALFLVSKDIGKTEQIKNNLEFILNIIKENPDFEKIMKNPFINKDKKKELLKEIFGGKVEEVILNFLFFLIDKKRENLLNKIYEIFLDKFYESKGTRRILIETAIKIDEKQKKYLQKGLEKIFNKNLLLDISVNPGILGGIIIRDKMKMIDASLKQFLNSIKSKIEKSEIKKEKKVKKTIKNKKTNRRKK